MWKRIYSSTNIKCIFSVDVAFGVADIVIVVGVGDGGVGDGGVIVDGDDDCGNTCEQIEL